MDKNPMKHETVAQLLRANFKDKRTRISNDAIRLSADFIYLFALEGAYRASSQAKAEEASEVDVQHFEKILPKLLLDF